MGWQRIGPDLATKQQQSLSDWVPGEAGYEVEIRSKTIWGGLLASIPVAGKRRKRTREAELWWSCHQWHHLALRGAVQTSDCLDLSWAGGRGNFRAPADWWLVQAPWGEAVTLGGKALHLRQPPWGADNREFSAAERPILFLKAIWVVHHSTDCKNQLLMYYFYLTTPQTP